LNRYRQAEYTIFGVAFVLMFFDTMVTKWYHRLLSVLEET
jgi:hypothetical protein